MPVHDGEQSSENEVRIKAEADLKSSLASPPAPERGVLASFYSSVAELNRKRASNEISESTESPGLTSSIEAIMFALTKESKLGEPEVISENIEAQLVSYLFQNPIVEVLMAASAAFQQVEAGRSWLSTPIQAFGNKPPLAMVATAEGRKLILNELGLIEHGMF